MSGRGASASRLASALNLATICAAYEQLRLTARREQIRGGDRTVSGPATIRPYRRGMFDHAPAVASWRDQIERLSQHARRFRRVKDAGGTKVT